MITPHKLVFVLFISTCVHAQVRLDGSLGQSTRLDLSEVIPAEVGLRQGANLFHSFEHFSIEPQQSVFFTTFDDTQRIIARVTGDMPSVIAGKISTGNHPISDFYLLNPNGIVFQHGASLDINGNFYASSADYLHFAPDVNFYADKSASSQFSSATPAAFGFLDNQIAPISVNNTVLKANKYHDIHLVGGDITLSDARLFVIDANIGLSAHHQAGTVSTDPKEQALLGGTITLENTKQTTFPQALVVTGQQAGDIFIRAGQFFLRQAEILNNKETNQAQSNQSKTNQIHINAQHIHLSNADINSFSIGTLNTNTADVQLSAAHIELSQSHVRVKAEQAGSIGNITLDAADYIVLDQSAILTAVKKHSQSNNPSPQHIKLTAPMIRLKASNVAQNNYAIHYQQDMLMRIQAQSLSLDKVSKISHHNVNMDANKHLQIDCDYQLLLNHTSFIQSPAGTIQINAANMVVLNGSRLDAASDNTQAQGGDIQIQVQGHLDLYKGNITTTATNTDAGQITIKKPQFLIFRDSKLNGSSNLGNGGDITYQADYLFDQQDNLIVALSRQKDAGVIQQSVEHTEFNSSLLAIPTQLLSEVVIQRSCQQQQLHTINHFVIKPMGQIKRALEF